MEPNEIIHNRYIINKLIGNGTFGHVYQAKCKRKNILFAIKTESLSSPYKSLMHECSVLKYLYNHRCRSIPTISWYGLHRNLVCLVTPLYDLTLSEYLQQQTELPSSIVNKLFCKLIHLMQSIHTLHVIHRDIKPDNFMLKNGELFLIDFGLAHVCIDENSEHIPNIQQTEITGNLKYSSYYVMTGHTPSIRDDIISLGYLFLYVLHQELPWDNVPQMEDSQYPRNHIMHIRNRKFAAYKQLSSIKQFSTVINQPLIMYFQYTYCLTYDEVPSYQALINLFT